MKYISLTFDDGRDDNYLFASPILKNNSLPATLFCTTGFVDRTWAKSNDWLSADNPLTVDNLKDMKTDGWEIALHGDTHIMDIDDTISSVNKLRSWGILGERSVGFSIPDSIVNLKKCSEYESILYPSTISYIRRGRNIDTRRLYPRLLFGLYSVFNIQWAYNRFNESSISTISSFNPRTIYSVVIRYHDKPNMIIKFIKSIPDSSCVVFMLHSILPSNHTLCGKDVWCWKSEHFSALCRELKMLRDEGIVDVLTLQQMVKVVEEKNNNG